MVFIRAPASPKSVPLLRCSQTRWLGYISETRKHPGATFHPTFGGRRIHQAFVRSVREAIRK